ncbi:sensor histidine kinase [Chitinophaga vietnamensis]|uniref:sensor histidine kinase n=1 Tax=Chitinophaga vietnamensis TaxID=2593957 RepID=UPI001177F2E7|nr:sensor histidine kinase [Chitinophaga vietnamensis]
MLTFFRRNVNNTSPGAQRLADRFAVFLSEESYTPGVRVATHALMWLAMAVLYTLMLATNFSEKTSITLVFVARNIIGSMGFFYFTFYLVIPRLLLRGYVVPAIICLCIPFYFWSIINYLSSVWLLERFNFDNKALRHDVERVVAGGWAGVFKLTHILRISIAVIMTVAPAMIIKLVLDFMRTSTRSLRLQRDNLNLEVSFLKSQLNPHFLFNTLNNIYALSIKNDALAPDLIMYLSEMMRYTLYDSNTEKVALSKEAEFLKNYVELESIRYGKSADIYFKCDPEGLEAHQIAPLLMFPFVENAFKYSHSTAVGHCWIHAAMHVEEGRLFFEITNSKGEVPEKKKGIGGIGLANTRKRLSLLYPGRHELEMTNGPDAYKVKLVLTLT